MNKICTSLEQSKKLIELGIDVNTADMYWSRCTITDFGDNTLKVSYAVEPCNISQFRYTKEDVPAWSLSALLGFIKSEIYGENIYGDTVTYKVDFRKYKFTDDIDLYQIAYGSIKFDADGHHSFKDMVNTGEKENLIDAAFEMVVWLKENKKI